jgi:chromate transport protein ChrA
MNMLSFIGLVWVIQFFNAYIKRPKLLTYSLFLTPSLLFWSSGVLKEGIILFALGLLLKYTNKLVKEFKLQFIVLIAFAIGLLIFTKIYIALILAPGLICWFIDERFSLKFRFIHYLGFYFGLFLLVYLTTNPIDRLVKKQHDLIENAAGGTYIERQTENQYDTIFIAASKHELITIRQKSVSIDTSIHFAQEVKHGDPGKCIPLLHNNKTNYRLLLDIGVTGSDFNMKPLEPNLIDLLSQTPASLANVFLRPFPNELTSPLQIISFSENLIIAIIILITLIKNSKNKLINLEIMSILFVLFLFWVIGITTPIAGAIMRYKVIGYVFLIPILIQRIKKAEPQTCDSTS